MFLRSIEPSDVDFMYEVENDCEAWQYSDIVAPLSRHMLLQYALNYDADPFSAGQLRLILANRGNELPVGIIDLYEISLKHKRAFIGIYISKKYRRKGVAEKALYLLEEYSRSSLHLHQLAAKVQEGNPAAEKLFTKCGYIKRCTLPDWISLPTGEFTSLSIYSKLL